MKLLAAAGLAILAWAALATWSEAHEAPSGWRYDAICCSNRDCAPISDIHVRETPQGYHVRLTHEDHFIVRPDRPIDTIIPHGHRRLRHAPDGMFHACVNHTSTGLLCLYVPPRSY